MRYQPTLDDLIAASIVELAVPCIHPDDPNLELLSEDAYVSPKGVGWMAALVAGPAQIPEVFTKFMGFLEQRLGARARVTALATGCITADTPDEALAIAGALLGEQTETI